MWTRVGDGLGGNGCLSFNNKYPRLQKEALDNTPSTCLDILFSLESQNAQPGNLWLNGKTETWTLTHYMNWKEM